HLLVKALQLVEERELLSLLVRVLLDLAAFAFHVGGRDLGFRALGEVGAGCHRERRRDRPGQPGCEDEARPAGGTGNPRHDAEYRGQPVVGAIDRARDPTRAGSMPLLATEDPAQANLA